MAHIVGVPKREPCKHCGLPVFFAERLAIDGSFYHRKCLRCARCDSQLTPGSFYETEVDGVFCCETCPDEETKMRLGNNNVEQISKLSPDEQRQSFSEKLAMFQTNGKGLLQKSLSDEEKSKSLKRLSELYSKAHDTNDTKPTITEPDDGDKDDPTSIADENAQSIADEASTSENSDEEYAKPPLPKTLPPSFESHPPAVEATKPKLPPIPSKANVLNKLYGKAHQESVKSIATISGAKFNTQTSTEPSIVTNKDNEQSTQIEPLDKSANEMNDSETPKTNSQTEEDVKSIESNLNTNNSLPLDALNSLTNVTKENAESIEASQHNANVHHLEDKGDSNQIADDDNDNIYVEQATNTNNVMQLEKMHSSMDNESAMCEQEHVQEQAKKQDKEIENGQQATSINSNDCNENKSIDKYDTNKLENITDIRERSSSISDNDSQKMVRSRLSQFEALVQSSEQKQTAHYSPRFSRSSAVAAEIPSEQTGRKKSIDVDDDDELNVTGAHAAIEQLNVELEPQLSATQFSSNDDDENNVNSNASTNANSEKILNTSDINDLDAMKPVPRQRATVNVCLDDVINNITAALPPTPLKRRQKTVVSEKLTENNHEDNCNNLDVEHKELPESSLSSEDNEHKKCETIYPDGLNPFGSDDEDEEKNHGQNNGVEPPTKRKDSLNPFDSEDDEIELMKDSTPKKSTTNNSYRISTNPFGSDDENEEDDFKRTPVPTPRKPLNGLQTTPEASPRMYSTLHPKMRLHGDDDLRGSNASLGSPMSGVRTSSTLNRLSKVHGSMSSLASSTLRHKKGRAPDIPMAARASISASSSPSHSVRATPVSRKKRAAPPPPKHQSMKSDLFTSSQYLTVASQLDGSLGSRHTISSESIVDLENSLNFAASIESNYVSSSNDMSLSSTERSHIASEDFKSSEVSSDQLYESTPKKIAEPPNAQRKLIPVDESLLDDLATKNIAEMPAEEEVTYRRKIIPDQIITPIKSDLTSATDRQCEKMKENKESKNRQSQISLPSNVLDDSSQVYSPNKSSYGKWKRRKGPAPSLPIPPRKVIQMLPLQEIRHELEVIEVQQQGLEKQGVMLEKMIRERCEGTENENQPLSECKPNSKEVEDLILQLFELVNEKNELFRRQAELMYLRRQHRLEQEQADIEYEIRVLMAQPECNKTDTDKAREEALISRLVDVVQLRNAVIESLEMDRIREAEEDQSIKERLEMHTAKRDEELCQQTPVKLSKKEKKKQKESKKLAKQKKMDADKDADESEISQLEKSKEKKKKKKFLF